MFSCHRPSLRHTCRTLVLLSSSHLAIFPSHSTAFIFSVMKTCFLEAIYKATQLSKLAAYVSSIHPTPQQRSLHCVDLLLLSINLLPSFCHPILPAVQHWSPSVVFTLAFCFSSVYISLSTHTLIFLETFTYFSRMCCLSVLSRLRVALEHESCRHDLRTDTWLVSDSDRARTNPEDQPHANSQHQHCLNNHTHCTCAR